MLVLDLIGACSGGESCMRRGAIAALDCRWLILGRLPTREQGCKAGVQSSLIFRNAADHLAQSWYTALPRLAIASPPSEALARSFPPRRSFLDRSTRLHTFYSNTSSFLIINKINKRSHPFPLLRFLGANERASVSGSRLKSRATASCTSPEAVAASLPRRTTARASHRDSFQSNRITGRRATARAKKRVGGSSEVDFDCGRRGPR